MRVSFDSDVLVYAALPGHPLGQKVRQLLTDSALDGQRFGSVFLLTELFIKPVRLQKTQELRELRASIARLELLPCTLEVASAAVALGATYGLKAVDATHLATAVDAGADAFLTNNRKDFDKATILELDILYPDDL